MNQRLRGKVSRFFHRMELTNRRDDDKEEEKDAEETSDGSAALPRFHFLKNDDWLFARTRALKYIFRGVCLTFCFSIFFVKMQKRRFFSSRACRKFEKIFKKNESRERVLFLQHIATRRRARILLIIKSCHQKCCRPRRANDARPRTFPSPRKTESR